MPAKDKYTTPPVFKRSDIRHANCPANEMIMQARGYIILIRSHLLAPQFLAPQLVGHELLGLHFLEPQLKLHGSIFLALQLLSTNFNDLNF